MSEKGQIAPRGAERAPEELRRVRVLRRLVAGQLWVRLLVAVISIALIASAALALRGSQRAASDGVKSRFDVQGSSGR